MVGKGSDNHVENSEQIKPMGEVTILAIESSCDDTAAAVCISNALFTCSYYTVVIWRVYGSISLPRSILLHQL
jgi:hypothetical protein